MVQSYLFFYVFFYLRIIIRSHKKELTETSRYDPNDIIKKKKQVIKPPTKATAKVRAKESLPLDLYLIN